MDSFILYSTNPVASASKIAAENEMIHACLGLAINRYAPMSNGKNRIKSKFMLFLSNFKLQYPGF
jgi:hypothetical protein